MLRADTVPVSSALLLLLPTVFLKSYAPPKQLRKVTHLQSNFVKLRTLKVLLDYTVT